MKKLFLSFLFIMAGLTCWADEYYIVGDASPCGWSMNDARKMMQMSETATPGVYEYKGLLKNGGSAAGNGFYICTALNNWAALYPQSQYPISDTGSCSYQTDTEYKWNPTNTDWQFYTITLNTNNQTVSWEAGDAFITPDADGYYNIDNPSDLFWFSRIAIGTPSVKAKLTADIDYTAYPKGFIGLNSNRYAGTFDGQEHTVTLGINNDIQGTGLFGVINGATIKNLIIDGNIEASKKWIGGIGGLTYGNCTVENVVVKAAIKFTGSGDATLGGLFGDMEAASNVKNCAFYGSVNAPNGQNVRGLASWCSGGVQFTNCIIAPTEVIAASSSDFANGSYTNTNCIKVSATDARFATGELCYSMNGDQSSINWYQNLSGSNVDALPVPFSSHSQVYANGALNCDGTSAGGDLVYSNSSTSTIPPHTDNGNGRCTVCGNLIPDHLATDSEGFYEITDASDLKWFADYVQEVNQSAKGKLTADIDYTAYPQGFIGTSSKKFAGTFDGQGYTISLALVSDAKIRGLFAFINGATIKNLFVDGSITSASYNNIGGLGGQADGTNTIENVVVKTTINYTPGSGDASIGGFFPYVNSGTTNFNNCAFYGKIKAGSANGNGGLISWNSGTVNATNCLVAPAEVEAGALTDYARPSASTTNCFKVDASDARLASGELCYLLNGSVCYSPSWTQTIGTDALPVPFLTQGIVNKITEAGYATQFIPTTDVTIPAGVEAFTGKINGNHLLLIAIEGAISKDNAVILKGSEGFYSFVPTTGATPAAQNDLVATTTETACNGNQYCLAKINDVVGFYKVNTDIPAGKAYLEITSAIKGFTFIFDDDVTGINDLKDLRDSNDLIYNLAGQRLQKMQKGINIVGGKKILF